ncbi:M56 family metallopeptidase [Polaribacter pectinis]|uniref:M56 family metallopeptidase n=1 Tax=Polaribacter pectinis TaxID=2738844 RepID=A0A7G9LAI7_9FLAO|nr:M56 family metallopeptidase [Polaribacter pectinis]QNM85636.1 M56 family metallopeptidase [Polaribacter pectinis]
MITYIIKSTSCLALLLFFYHFILEKEKMHNFNRFYLLGSILFSFLVPFVTITVNTISANEALKVTTFTQANVQTEMNDSIGFSQFFILFYFTISVILAIRFGINLFKIIQKIRLNEKIKYKKATLILVDDKILPHTFWKAIFINKNDYKEGNIEEELFTHELTHVTQKHTLDVLLIEFLQIIFWINPLFIFIKKAIQLNHEFIADSKVINKHKNTFQYQHLLLNKAAWNNEYYLASNLNYSLTKKRLKMMTTKSSQTKVWFKKLAVIPLIIGFIFLFAERIEAQETSTKTALKEYNTLAKKYNKQPKDKRVIKLKDINRLEFLYKQLSETEKKNAEPFPECPPPPKTPSKKISITNKKDGKKVEFTPPPPPRPHLDQVISMAKKGAIFYFEKEQIDSDKAISLLKKNKNLSIHSESTNNSNYKVWISKTALDSATKNDNIKYYLDNKLISKEEMELISTDKIASVNVKKNKDGSGAVYITSKK